MNESAIILFPGESAWTFVATTDGLDAAPRRVAVSPDTAPSDIANAVAEALRMTGYAGERVLLALPTRWCLNATISARDLPAKNRRRSMIYRLEESLPLSAEELVADFLTAKSSDARVTGVAVEKARIMPIVDALEAAGVTIASISPASLLALQRICSDPLFANSPDLIIWPADTDGELELFLLRDGQLTGWLLIPDDPADLKAHVGLSLMPAEALMPTPANVVLIGDRPDLRAALERRPGVTVTTLDTRSLRKAATSQAESVLAGTDQTWIELRRDDLAPKDPLRLVRAPLTAAGIAAVVLVVCLIAAMLLRAHRYDRLASDLADAQQAVFRQSHPNVPIPEDVLSRLSAEERGLRGLSGDTGAPPPAVDGLPTLRDLLAHLPSAEELRYRIVEVRLDPDRFTLEGQVRSHGDADLIAAALRRGGEFSVEPPRTERVAGRAAAEDSDDKPDAAGRGVGFTIVGTWTRPVSTAVRRER